MAPMMGYRLNQLVGVGTFAEVWHAERVDEEGKRRAPDVALKIASCPLDDNRSDRERAVLYQTAPLQLPGTIRVLDITSHNNRMVVALELADDSLLGLLRKGLSRAECVRFIGEVATTLDELHSRRIVHGGINPTDILVRDGHAYVADFGPLPCETATSGTPFYKAVCMAPELRQREPRPESDQFALAATYTWLRLRHGAFQVPHRGGFSEGINIGLLDPPEKNVLLTALNRQPQQRFTSCSAFVQSLQQVL
jgi:serine/threonine protein kinase